MSAGDMDTAVSSFRARYAVRPADTADLTREACRLRHQVHCLERGCEPDEGGLERDEFDAHAQQAVVCERHSGEVIGTVRLILPVGDAARVLPIQRLCAPGLLGTLPLETTAEVSRLAVSRQRRDRNAAADSLLHLGLVQGAVRLSHDLGITHWCAVMERSLLRLLRTMAIHFAPVGPCIEHYGLRQPAIANLGALLARMERDQPAIWSLVTDDGRFRPGRSGYFKAA